VNILESKWQKGVNFIVGQLHHLGAWFLPHSRSPMIDHPHSEDPSVSEFICKTVDNDHQVPECLSLGLYVKASLPISHFRIG
jgi:hypothetical protein